LPSKRNVFCEKEYGDHGDRTAIVLRLHGVYTATVCGLWAFVPRSKRFHHVFTAFLLRSKRFHCVFKALSPNEQQTFFYFFSALVLWFQRRVKQKIGAKNYVNASNDNSILSPIPVKK
jgi:hypothetical protein